MVKKPVRLLCYMFLWPWKCTTFKSIDFISIVLTNKNFASIYSVTICQQKRILRIVHFQGASNINRELYHCCFYHWCNNVHSGERTWGFTVLGSGAPIENIVQNRSNVDCEQSLFSQSTLSSAGLVFCFRSLRSISSFAWPSWGTARSLT